MVDAQPDLKKEEIREMETKKEIVFLFLSFFSKKEKEIWHFTLTINAPGLKIQGGKDIFSNFWMRGALFITFY